MIEPGLLWREAGRRGARMIAWLSGLIVLVLGLVFFGLSVIRPVHAGIVAAGAAVAAVYAFQMWRSMAIRSGALVAGAVAPLVGAFLMDVLQSIYAGSGEGLANSLLLAYWPVGVLAVAAGIGAALATTAYVRRRFDHTNVSGMLQD